MSRQRETEVDGELPTLRRTGEKNRVSGDACFGGNGPGMGGIVIGIGTDGRVFLAGLNGEGIGLLAGSDGVIDAVDCPDDLRDGGSRGDPGPNFEGPFRGESKMGVRVGVGV